MSTLTSAVSLAAQCTKGGCRFPALKLELTRRFNSQILSIIVSCLYLAAGVTAPLAGVIANRYGRRVYHLSNSRAMSLLSTGA